MDRMLGDMTSRKWFLVQTKSLIAGLCLGVPTGLIISLTLYASFDLTALDEVFNGSHVFSNSRQFENEYLARFELQREELIREVLANLSSSSTTNVSCNCEQPAPSEVVVYKERVVKEWESHAVLGITDNEASGERTLGEIPRRFVPVGTGSFLFVKFGVYRTGARSFGVVGLSARSVELSHRIPQVECIWESASGDVEKGTATKYFPPNSNNGQYITLVVQCEFYTDVGVDGKGGELRMAINHGDGDNSGLENVEFVALTEKAGDYDGSVFEAPYKYDYMYCGSPLWAGESTVGLSPQRMREWITYHMMVFGPRSHFVLYDAGGISEEVGRVLEPWLKLGRLTIMNVRQQSRYDSVYYNQFLLLNDCLYRAKSLTKWAFFFDVDEFLHIDPQGTLPQELLEEQEDIVENAAQQQLNLANVMARVEKRGRRATTVVFPQRPMNDKHCVANNETEAKLQSKWAMEKLVFKRLVLPGDPFSHWEDHKYAAQVQLVMVVGIHITGDVVLPPELSEDDAMTYMWMRWPGCSNCIDANFVHYYHYHNTVNIRNEVCREFVNPGIRSLNIILPGDNGTYELDDTMTHDVASAVRKFELELVGPQPTII